MTQDEIIELAKHAGLLEMDYELGDWEIHEFTIFAQLVAAKEREACDQLVNDDRMLSDNDAIRLSKAIRARGEA